MRSHGWAIVYSGLPKSSKDGSATADYVVTPHDSLREGEVRIQGLYTSLTYKDHLVASGARGFRTSGARGVGTDYVGTVKKSNSAEFSEGDLVWVVGSGLSSGSTGGVTEFLTVHEAEIHHLPDGWSAELAALGGTPLLTAALAWQSWDWLDEIDSLVVSGASGAVGHFSLIFAGERKVNRVTVVTNREKEHFKKLGLPAQKLIPTATLAEPVGLSLLPERWDAAIDALGGNILANLLKACRLGARIAAVGNVLGSQAEFDLAPFLLRRVTLMGINLETAIASQYESLVQECGKLKDNLLQGVPHIFVSPSKVDETLRLQAQGRSTGRVLVRLSP